MKFENTVLDSIPFIDAATHLYAWKQSYRHKNSLRFIC